MSEPHVTPDQPDPAQVLTGQVPVRGPVLGKMTPCAECGIAHAKSEHCDRGD